MRLLVLALLGGAVGCRNGKLDPSEEGLVDTGPEAADADGDGYDSSEDCDDADGAVNPGGIEVCDGVDNDCDGTADEDVTTTSYADADGDGFGDAAAPAESCDVTSGYSAVAGDCDDADAGSYPGALEICDGADNDCDGAADDDVITTVYADSDGDGYGADASAEAACAPGAGQTATPGDCDDTDSDAFPGGAEVCDEADNDCDGQTDEGVQTTFYADLDGDGFGVDDKTAQSCDLLTGYAPVSGDCDDAAAAINPDASEVCNEADDDCDGQTDEGVQSTFYADSDGDGFGDPGVTAESCEPEPGYVADDADCDDAAATANPAAAEICDGADNDCDGDADEDSAADAGAWHHDSDGDDYGDPGVTTASCEQPAGYVADGTDCDDADADTSPAASERCDGEDDDCDGSVDEDAIDDAAWYADADGDSYGDAASPLESCSQPAGYVADNTDCADGAASVNPGGSEVCNDIDDDCDGSTDEGASDADTWHIDSDNDGYGGVTTTSSCDAPAGYAADGGDCDEANPDVSPGAAEVCNDVDDDCDGASDDGACDCTFEEYGGRTYLFCAEAMTWDAAADACVEYGYALADVQSAAEDAWLFATARAIAADLWWFGFNDYAAEGSFVWEGGAAVTYTRWWPGEPNNSYYGIEQEECVHYGWYVDGSWNDFWCGQQSYFICKD